MIAANQLYNVAKPDGLTLAMISSGLYFDQLMGVKEVKCDWAKYGWIGSPVRNFEVLTMRADTPYGSIEEIRKAAQPPRCGTTGTGTIGRRLITPPNVPVERVKILRDGFARMIADPDFLAETRNGSGTLNTSAAPSSRRLPRKR